MKKYGFRFYAVEIDSLEVDLRIEIDAEGDTMAELLENCWVFVLTDSNAVLTDYPLTDASKDVHSAIHSNLIRVLNLFPDGVVAEYLQFRQNPTIGLDAVQPPPLPPLRGGESKNWPTNVKICK